MAANEYAEQTAFVDPPPPKEAAEDNQYTVVWVINIVASTPREAASIAREIQLDHDNWSGVFQVYDGILTDDELLHGDYEEIDLDADAEGGETDEQA